MLLFKTLDAVMHLIMYIVSYIDQIHDNYDVLITTSYLTRQL